MHVFLIDIDRCNGCYNCQLACKDEHVGNDWSPIAKPQPDTGHFWLKIDEVVQGSVPKVRVRYVINMCQHCERAPCMESCGTGAIYKRDDGIVIIDPDKCKGCRECIESCPYKSVYFNDELKIAQKCTGCAHILDKSDNDNGLKEPRCVDACPTGAIKFGTEEDLRDDITGARLLRSDHGTQPRVYYKGLPDRYFIAGAVFDPDIDEVLEGAHVILTNLKTEMSAVHTTDLFGDFWFERQEQGSYSIKIEKKGYVPYVSDIIEVTKDVNIGDIAMHKV